ncbi:MAG: hypothetical protein JNM27_15995 [Leptospirales bacterium]|nr:hypothetical protein [Leptospirales bacterium]
MKSVTYSVRARCISLCLVFLAASACNRGFEKYDSPKVMLSIRAGAPVEVLAEADVASARIGQLNFAEPVDVTGLWTNEKKGALYQIVCPATIPCKNQPAFVPQPHTLGIAIVVPPEEKSKAIKTIEWLNDPRKETPQQFHHGVVGQFMNAAQEKEAEKDRIVSDLAFFVSGFRNPTQMTDSRLQPLLQRYKSLGQLQKLFIENQGVGFETSPLAKIEIDSELTSQVEKEWKAREEAIIAGFPLRSESWPGLAIEFNKMRALPYLQEKLLIKSLEDTTYDVSDAEYPQIGKGAETDYAIWEINVRPWKGVFLNVKRVKKPGSTMPDKEEKDIEIRSVKAEASPNGLAFRVSTADREYLLRPQKIAPYLAIGGPGLSSFIAGIPQNYKEINSSHEFHRAILLTAMKFGKGGFDSNTGSMRYDISFKQADPRYEEAYYWMMFDLIRNAPEVNVEGNGYNGTFKEIGVESAMFSGAGGMQIGELKWYQPAGEFKVQYKVYGGSENGEPTEETCFSKGREEIQFAVIFAPSEIHKEKPAVRIYLGEPLTDPQARSRASVCQHVIGSLGTKK